MNTQQKLWIEFYKIGMEKWHLPDIDRPVVYNNDSEIPKDIHEYAYWFAEAFINNYNLKFQKDFDYRYDVWKKEGKSFVADTTREKPEICECFTDEDSLLICELLNKHEHTA